VCGIEAVETTFEIIKNTLEASRGCPYHRIREVLRKGQGEAPGRKIRDFMEWDMWMKGGGSFLELYAGLW
jgi:hypothetical protein